MTEKPQLRYSQIDLSAQDLDELVRLMEESHSEVKDFEIEGEVEANSRLNKQLQLKYQKYSVDQAFSADPTSLSNDDLWNKISGQLPQRSKVSKNKKLSSLTLVLSAASAAALLLLISWPRSDEGESFRIKGVFFGSDAYKRQSCELALRSQGEIFELGLSNLELPPSQPVSLFGKCQKSGFLHLEIKGGGESVSFENLAVASSGNWQELKDKDQVIAGILTPSSGTLSIRYGFTLIELSPIQAADLYSTPLENSPWQWIREDSWSIKSR